MLPVRFLSDPQFAEDAVQEAIKTLLTARKPLTKKYLFRATKWAAYNINKQLDRFRKANEAEILRSLTGTPQYPRAILWKQLQELIATHLPPHQQRVLQLRILHGSTLKEIAAATGYSITKVHRLLEEGTETLQSKQSNS